MSHGVDHPRGNGTATLVLLSAGCRPLRHSLRPQVWVVLEEVALDVVPDGDGRLVARTSARLIAQRLGVDPGTVAGALRVLRDRGLVILEREQGKAGRFGLSVYVLGSLDGLSVVLPGMANPPTALSQVVRPCVAGAAMTPPCTGWPHEVASVRAAAVTDSPHMEEPHLAVPAAAAPRLVSPCALVANSTSAEDIDPVGRETPQEAAPSLPHCPGQESLDFGTASS
jgi:DNA-binding transcriptional ArsR family regulator